jgi:Flp pilus assembly protein TadD
LAAYSYLGMALLADGRYREAADTLERVLPGMSTDQKRIFHESLAFAYVVLDDDRNARRILRLIVQEEQVEARLKRLHEATARDPNVKVVR